MILVMGDLFMPSISRVSHADSLQDLDPAFINRESAVALYEQMTHGLTYAETCHSHPFAVQLDNQREVRFMASGCSHARRSMIYCDQLTSDPDAPAITNCTITEAVVELARSCPWFYIHRPSFLVHQETLSGEHRFSEVTVSMSHGHVIGYGSESVGCALLGYARVAAILREDRYLVDQPYPDLLPATNPSCF